MSAGSSPRGRGTPIRTAAPTDLPRFIPARAGNTSMGVCSRPRRAVHPRAGGEHAGRPGPRVPQRRFIPARAGNTRSRRGRRARAAVHPRAGGEHRLPCPHCGGRGGSSPRGRGTLRSGAPGAAVYRFIPARAGNTRGCRPASGRTPVHPRAGGEHIAGVPSLSDFSGSSPRGRGTPGYGAESLDRPRFIPARAGNTTATGSSASAVSVHPRAGGEHALAAPGEVSSDGSSPRGRGTPPRVRRSGWGHRFIPARAGNTGRGRAARRATPVHPRAGGEHRTTHVTLALPAGSSPRGRGTPHHPRHPRAAGRFIPARAGNTARRRTPPRRSPGSSPRGRGTLEIQLDRPESPRFIPARAGNTPIASPRASRPSVHPRAGGEHTELDLGAWAAAGSSPRGRGTLEVPPRLLLGRRFIPARAGNTLRVRRWRTPGPVHPRAGGEHFSCERGDGSFFGSSPRGRGTPQSETSTVVQWRFIPARAGNTPSVPSAPGAPSVHPRAGGEHFLIVLVTLLFGGSSPRGRGTRPGASATRHVQRFIPARAGNTLPATD